jgi:hypothetical protein
MPRKQGARDEFHEHRRRFQPMRRTSRAFTEDAREAHQRKLRRTRVLREGLRAAPPGSVTPCAPVHLRRTNSAFTR